MYSNKNVVERLGNARHEYGAVRFLLSGISQAAITCLLLKIKLLCNFPDLLTRHYRDIYLNFIVHFALMVKRAKLLNS